METRSSLGSWNLIEIYIKAIKCPFLWPHCRKTGSLQSQWSTGNGCVKKTSWEIFMAISRSLPLFITPIIHISSGIKELFSYFSTWATNHVFLRLNNELKTWTLSVADGTNLSCENDHEEHYRCWGVCYSFILSICLILGRVAVV